MGKRENFTVGKIEAFTCMEGKQQSIYWDGKTPGLGLRVTAAGTRSYVFETQLHGKTIRITIGDVRTWTVGKAQAEATRLKGLTDQGTDPRQVKADKAAASEAAQAHAKRQAMTVSEVWNAYVADRTPTWGERHLRDHANMTKPDYPLASLLPLNISELDADHVKAWLRTEAARRPTQAALGYRLLRAFVRWCADTPAFKDVTHADACSTRTAKDTLPKPGVKDDCLQREQLPVWFAAVRSIGNPVIAAYLQALLLTGPRREELAGLKWEDVDFQWKAVTIKDKVEGQRVIPLTPFVASLLAALPRRNEWVFSSPTSASGRLMEPSIQHRRVTAAAGLDALSLHGLRRSFGTLSEWCEVPVGVVAQIQGHKPSAIAEKHYRRRPLDLLRMWHEKIEAWILEQAGVQFVADQSAAGLRVVK